MFVGVFGNECDRRVGEELTVVLAVADREHVLRVDARELAVGEHAAPLGESVRADGHAVAAEVAMGDARVGVALERIDHSRDHTLVVAEHAEGEHGNGADDLVEVAVRARRPERGQVLPARGRSFTDVDVEVVVLHVDAGLEISGLERREHRQRGVDVEVMPVEALAGGEVEAERAVEHHCRRREPVVGERLPCCGRAASGRDQHRHAAAVELGPRRERPLVRNVLGAVRPQRAVEIGDDELCGPHARAQWRRRRKRLRMERIATSARN